MPTSARLFVNVEAAIVCAVLLWISVDLEQVILSAAARNVLLETYSDERDTLKKAVATFAHDPIKSQLLSRLDAENADYGPGNEEWNHLTFCIEQHHLHAQTEVRRYRKRNRQSFSWTRPTPW